jgi:hypothetical protein
MKKPKAPATPRAKKPKTVTVTSHAPQPAPSEQPKAQPKQDWDGVTGRAGIG